MTYRPPPITTIPIVALLVTTTIPLRTVFDGWGWAPGVLGAIVVAAILATALETYRGSWPGWLMAAAAGTGAILWSLLTALRSTVIDDPTGLVGELVSGVFDGWSALLDDRSPLTDPVGAETFVTVLAWGATAVAVHVAARFRLASAALLVGAAMLWVTSAAAQSPGTTSVALGAVAGAFGLLAIATLTRATGQKWHVGPLVTLGAVVIVSAIAATALAAFSDSFDRRTIDPRSSRTTDVVDVEVDDLLAEYGVRRDGEEPILTVEGLDTDSPARLRLQAYETHDGERWVPTAGYEDLATFPEPEELPPGEILSFTVAVDELDGPWIPLPDRLISIDTDNLRWNEPTQTALTTGATRFEITGAQVGRDGLDSVMADTEFVPDSVTALPAGLPEVIRTEAAAATEGTTDTLAASDAIVARLQELGRDESGTPGHSLGRLRDDLENGRATGAEQIASLHALMLRSVGIPSRVVVGVTATDGEVQPTDLQVWTEVPFPDVGWVALDPVPAATESAAGPEEPTATTTTLPEDAALEARALPRELGPGEDPDPGEVGGDREVTRTTLVVAALLGMLCALLTLIVTRLTRRRVRASTGLPPDVRILGAWAETVDRLREQGITVRPTTTLDDVVELATDLDEELGADVDRVAALAAEAFHGPTEPDDGVADDAWARLADVETRLSEVRGRQTMARRYLDPRVLRYRVPDPPRTRAGGRTRVTTRSR